MRKRKKIFEAMNKNKAAFGIYICFDRVIDREEEAENFAEEMSMLKNKIVGNDDSDMVQNRWVLEGSSRCGSTMVGDQGGAPGVGVLIFC